MKTMLGGGRVYLSCVLMFVAMGTFAKPRPPVPPLPELALNLWRFDHTNWWLAPQAAPSEMADVWLAESWSG